MTLRMDRRVLIRQAAGLAAAGMFAPYLGACTERAKIAGEYPFKLGVASGDPVSDGFVMWTRLAPWPFDPERMGKDPVQVGWQVATDQSMSNVVARGTELARPDRAFAVHVEARELNPGRPYWYRFTSGSEESAIGRAVTAPVFGAKLDKLRFAFASCQHYEQGYYTAYREMLSDHPDLVMHLGDYIYESSWGDPVRRHEGPEPRDLDHYRMRHALYKTDAHLQAMHAACPWLVTWDDHEVQNDYAADVAADGTPQAEFVKRRAAAFQAYWEHMPLRLSQLSYGGNMMLYTSNVWGDLVNFAMLDARQYRSPEACPVAPTRRGGHLALDGTCPELTADNRSMLGMAQEEWLTDVLGESRTKWNVLGSSILFAGVVQKDPQGHAGAYTDMWDGYPASRARILAALEKTKAANPIVLSGDIHSFWVNDVKRDYRVPESQSLATEFVSGSITSGGIPYDEFKAMLPYNPQVKFFESRVHGYGLCDVSPAQWQTSFRTVADIRDPNTKGGTLNSWVVEAGRPGAHKA